MYNRRSGGRSPMRAPPVNVGDEIDVIIEAVGEKGDGIAKKDGFILFVKETKQGETCRVRVTKVLQKVGFADKIGEAQGEVKPAEPRPQRQRRAQQAPPEPEPQSNYEDSDDFGADLDEDEDLELDDEGSEESEAAPEPKKEE